MLRFSAARLMYVSLRIDLKMFTDHAPTCNMLDIVVEEKVWKMDRQWLKVARKRREIEEILHEYARPCKPASLPFSIIFVYEWGLVLIGLSHSLTSVLHASFCLPASKDHFSFFIE